MAKKSQWQPYQKTTSYYKSSMQGLINKMTQLVNSSNSVGEMATKLDTFANSKSLSLASSDIASKMITMVAQEKEVNWRAAARKSSMGGYIYKALYRTVRQDYKYEYKSLIEQNATLIKTLPYDIAKSVALKAAKYSVEGMRASEIAKMIKQEFPDSTKAKAQLIARTEVSKASTAVTELQSKKFGFNWYVWKTSKDARVRSSHDHMDNVLINWNDTPAPEVLNKQKSEGNYHAGNIYNCRCYPEPLVDTGLLKWPHKVYHNGTIQMMTKAKFEAIANVPKQPVKQQQAAKTQPAAKPVKTDIDKQYEAQVKQWEKELKDEAKKQKVAAQKASLSNMQQKDSGVDVSYKYNKDDFKPLEYYEAFEMSNKHTEYIKKNRKAKDAIKAYTGSAYGSMNDYLRGYDNSPWESLKEQIKNIINVYKKAPPVADKDVELYRATGFSFISNALEGDTNFSDTIKSKFYDLQRDFYDVTQELGRGRQPAPDRLMQYEIAKSKIEGALKSKLIGVVATENAFTSTAYKRFAFGSSKDVQMKILAPKEKSEAMVITGISNYGESEAEVLFNAGMTYRIEDIFIEEVSGGVKITPVVVVVGHDEELKSKFV